MIQLVRNFKKLRIETSVLVIVHYCCYRNLRRPIFDCYEIQLDLGSPCKSYCLSVRIALLIMLFFSMCKLNSVCMQHSFPKTLILQKQKHYIVKWPSFCVYIMSIQAIQYIICGVPFLRFCTVTIGLSYIFFVFFSFCKKNILKLSLKGTIPGFGILHRNTIDLYLAMALGEKNSMCG